MNFIDTLVVIRQNGIIREHEIESVNFYNLDGIEFLDGKLSLWPNDHFTHTYYENGTIKFENYSHGGKLVSIMTRKADWKSPLIMTRTDNG